MTGVSVGDERIMDVLEWNTFWAVLMQACIAVLLLSVCLAVAGYFIASGITSGIVYKEVRLADEARKQQLIENAKKP